MIAHFLREKARKEVMSFYETPPGLAPASLFQEFHIASILCLRHYQTQWTTIQSRQY